MINPRILRVGVEVDGVMRYYEGLAIVASGTKTANAAENECEVKITNLSKQTRDYILTETSPFNQSKKPKRLILEAGRESTGLSVVFIGDITSATIGQPPDIEIHLKASTKSTEKGNIIARSAGGDTNLSAIAKDVAKDLGLTLQFEATDKKISNYSHTGANTKQVVALGKAGGVNAYIDDDKLVVKNNNAALKGASQTLNLESGMIGTPEITEHGIKVKYLYNNNSAIGGALIIESKLNPAASGSYSIFKLNFDISNRDTQFYLTAEAKRL